MAKAPAEKVRQVSNRRKAFLSYRCAQLMADAWKKNLNIFRHFDIRAHPVVTVERPFLKVNGSFAHPNMPQIEKFKASNEVLDLLERGGWVSIEEISEKTALEIQHLMTLGLIWSRLDVPQGTLEPIQYWKNLLNNELSQDAIVDLLAKFEKHLENFESLDIATRRDALNAAEDLFFEITQTSSRKAPGGYYSDRFILFLDEFNGREFVFEKKTIESLFQDLNLALEFMAPEWLWLLLKSYLPIALKEQDLREGMGSYEENYEKILSLCEIYATGQIDANASLSENEIFKSWVQDIKALMVERNKIVASIPREPRECEFILDKTLVSKYRESIRQVMAKHFDFPLPLYSSCFIFQVCLDDHAQPMAVHDSSIFGNAMNLMILNHLSLNIAEQKKETLSAMRAMLNATKDERLIQPSVTPSQQTKYSPWILPDEELPFLSLTHKSNEGFKTISDVARKDSKNQWRWNIPGHLRLSRKSVIESEGFVPRVRFGSATIQRATWMLKVPSILKESSKPNKEHLFSLYLKALSFKKQYHLPT
ncbi:MAG: hypothetical protein KDD48_09285, partial [Bdellovibrionales bacterium]|nr:hypothetical protein [Bdellovibrionales bacterium]